MITAKDAYLANKARYAIDEEILDNWIVKELYPRFSMDGRAKIFSKDVVFTKEIFLAAMTARGFHVSFKCEDRPCGAAWYDIVIPPQGD